MSTALAAQSAAHEVRPAITDVTVTLATVDMVIRLPLEPLLAGMNLAVLENTNDSPEAATHDALRALAPPQHWRQRFASHGRALQTRSTFFLVEYGLSRAL